MALTVKMLEQSSKAEKILERRLNNEEYIDGGYFKFEKCFIKENKEYLGFIHFFAIDEDGEVSLDIQLDKDPYNLYTMSLGNELFVGSKLYKVFSELGIVDCDGNADIGDLNYRNVRVILKRTSDGKLIVDSLEQAGKRATERFDIDDFIPDEVDEEDE